MIEYFYSKKNIRYESTDKMTKYQNLSADMVVDNNEYRIVIIPLYSYRDRIATFCFSIFRRMLLPDKDTIMNTAIEKAVVLD